LGLQRYKYFRNDDLTYFSQRLLQDNAVRDLNTLTDESKGAVQSFIDDLNKQLVFRRKMIENASLDMKPAITAASEYLASLRAEIKRDLADAPTV